MTPCPPPEGMYFIVLAARSQTALPRDAPRISLFADAEDSEGRRAETNAQEVLRLDQLLVESNAALQRQAERAQQLEIQAERAVGELNAARAEHEVQIAQRARMIGALEGRVQELVALVRSEQARLEAALSAQERIIAYRQSFRWWLKLPWIRVRFWLARLR